MCASIDDADQHLTCFDLDWIHGNCCLGVMIDLARLEIEGPRVPWADNLPILHPSLGKRTLPVRADIVDRGNAARIVGHTHLSLLDGELHKPARTWKLVAAA